MSSKRARSVFAFLVFTFAALSAQAQFGDVTVSKTGPAVAAEGTNVSYDVTVTNIGASAASSVLLSDPIPLDMTFVSATQNNGVPFVCTDPGTGNSGTVNCSTATLGAGLSANFTFVFNIGTQASPGQEFVNTATATTNPADANPNNNSATATTRTFSSDFIVSKSGPAQAVAGSNVSYNVTLFNFGPDASLVKLDDSIPSGMLFVSAVQNTGPAFTCSTPAVNDMVGTVTCNSDAPFPSGATATFTITFNIPPATPDGTFFTNVAISTSATDPSPENDSASATTSTPPAPSADMSVTKNGPTAAGPNTDVQYTITVLNAGPDAAANVSWTDTLPGDMTFVSFTQDSGPSMNCTAGGTTTCTAATFPAGVTATFTLTGHIPSQAQSGTSYSNTATVTSSTNDPNDGNNTTTTTVVVSTSDVSVVKTGPGTVAAGTNVSYTITLSNSGDTATDVELADVLPAGTTFVSFIQDNGPSAVCTMPTAGAASGSIGCYIPFFPDSASSQFTLVLNSGSAVTIMNTATVTATSFDPNNGNNSSTATTNVTQSANVGVAKNGPVTVNAGDTITYSVTVTNSGPSNATTVSLTDAVPTNTTFVSATQTSGPTFNCVNPPFGGTGTITCTIPTLTASALATFSFTFSVSPAATGSIDNTANISTATTDPTPGNNTSLVSAIVTQSANLGVTKTGPGVVSAGTQISYTVTATNSGPSNATTVSLTDLLPPNTTFASSVQNTGPAFNCVTPLAGSGGTITCTIATFAASGTATFTFVFNVSPAATGTIDNTANISSATTDPVPGNNSSTASATVGQSADLTVVKNGPATVTAGNTVTYTVTASNVGPSNASNVSLTDTLPPNTTFVSVTQNSGPVFTCTSPAPGATGTINCNIATLNGGGTSATFTIVMNVASGATGSLSNTANITAATADPTPGNNSSTTTATVGQSADLTVAKTGPAAVTAGSNITYTVTASNAGPSNAANVALTDVLPANTTFVSATQTSGPAFICTTPAVGAPGTITCTAATFASGATAVFSFVVNLAPAATGTVDNTASITSTTPDPTPANSSGGSSAAIGAGPTDVSITKTASAAGYVAGGDATFTLTVRNNGPGNAAGTTVTDVLPAGMTFVSATPSQGTCTGTTTVVCTLGALAPAATATITLVVRVPQTVGPVSNTATVAIANAETAPANNTSTATINVVAEIPALSPLALVLLAVMLAGVGLVMKR